MLYDRPYMRESRAPRSEPSAVWWLLGATVGVYALQMTLIALFPSQSAGRGVTWMSEWFALSGAHLAEGKFWTLATYGFLHSPALLLHIVGNMLGLFFIGRAIEPILGFKRFCHLYFGGILLAGLFFVAPSMLIESPGPRHVVGASGAVFAVLAFFCRLRPEASITLLLFFIIPVTLKPKWVLAGALAISGFGFLFYELGGAGSSVAHSAHLGGLAAGVLYHHFVYLGNRARPRPKRRVQVEAPSWAKRKKPPVSGYRVNISEREDLQKEVDRILDKINTRGFGSLSEHEKELLDRARNTLSR